MHLGIDLYLKLAIKVSGPLLLKKSENGEKFFVANKLYSGHLWSVDREMCGPNLKNIVLMRIFLCTTRTCNHLFLCTELSHDFFLISA